MNKKTEFMKSKYKRLNAQQWEFMKIFLPEKIKGRYGQRNIADAILWILRVGSQWRNLPVYFKKWEGDGTLAGLNFGLNMMERKRKGKNATPSMLSIDSQSVKAGPLTSLAKGIDGNKKVNGRKRHVVTDTLGLVWGVVVGPANEADGAVGQRVVEPLLGYLHRLKRVLADQAYTKVFKQWVEDTIIGLEVEISSRPPSEKGFVPVKWRWVTERTFGTYNFFRRLAKDYEKTPESQESWLFWQNCQIILSRMGK